MTTPPAVPVRRRRRARILSLIVLGLYGGIMIFGGCADRLLLFPSTEAVPAEGARQIKITGPDGNIDVWTTRTVPDGAPVRAYVLHFIGNASRAEFESSDIAREWADEAVEIWVVNYPGFGKSDGKARLKSIPPTAQTVYQELSLRAGKTPIVLSGRSMGNTAALYLATRHAAMGVVLQNPPPLRQIILRQYGWWNLWLLAGPVALQVPGELGTIDNAAASRIPAVFVMSEKDSVVPPPFQKMVQQSYAGPKQIIVNPGSDHNDPLEEPAMTQLKQALHALLAGQPPN